MEEHELINVNNLICETLHPKNPIAKYYYNKEKKASHYKLIY
jgi:hypothetical protein